MRRANKLNLRWYSQLPVLDYLRGTEKRVCLVEAVSPRLEIALDVTTASQVDDFRASTTDDGR